jgi:hypothetical protein
MDLWQHKKRSGLKRWHTWKTVVTPVEEKLVQHHLRWFGHIQRRPTEASFCSGIIRRFGNEKRDRGRPNLTWEKFIKRDLKDWCMTKKLALNRREWKLTIHISEPWSLVPSFLLSSVKVFFTLFHFFCLTFYCLFSFYRIGFFIVLRFTPSFLTLFYSCFLGSCDFIFSLPQLGWN